MTTTARYWHGGAPGLRPGDVLTPHDHYDLKHLKDGCPTCTHENYNAIVISTEREYCRIFAGGWPRGTLYRVEPIGELIDHKLNSGDAPAWTVTSAMVLSVYDPVVMLTDGQIRRAVKRWMDVTS